MNVADAIRQTRPAACVPPPPPPAHGTGLSPNGLQNIPPAGQYLYHEVPRARLIGTASGAVPERTTGSFRPSTIAPPAAAAWRQTAPPLSRQRDAADSTTQAWWDDSRAPLPVTTARRLAMEEEAAARGVHPKHVKDVDDHLGVVKARIDSDRRNALSRRGRDLNGDLALKRLADAIGFEALAMDLKLALVPALMRSLENRGHLPINRSLAPALPRPRPDSRPRRRSH